MDLNQILQRKKELEELLLPFEQFYSEEILNRYPDSLNYIDPQYIEELLCLDDLELFEFDCRRPVEKLKGTMTQKLIDRIKILTEIPPIEDLPEIELEDWAFTGVKFKKRHEIQKIASILKELNHNHSFKQIVDIGGGVGHLARTLAHYHGIETYSLDTNKTFQDQGMKRASRFRKLSTAKPLHFLNLTFGDAKDELKLKEIITPESLIVGLHTCGNLANDVIKTSLKYKTFGLLSFGCCYHKMNPKTDFPISTNYKNEHLKLSIYAMTLATRAHGEITINDYVTKQIVKHFRYILHFWLFHKENKKDVFDVGENNIRDYHGKFSSYAIPKLKNLNLTPPSADELDQFFGDEAATPLMKKLFIANLLRWQLGRALEVYILLDRALFLLENGYQVKLQTYFIESVSPRNLGILAYK